MSRLFSTKSLIFYGGSVLAVIALFSAATSYGVANLKAPRKIDGRYLLQAGSLPGCLQGRAIVLSIQQSGVYITGSLLPTDASEQAVRIAEERPSLSGHWENQQSAVQTGTIIYSNVVVTDKTTDQVPPHTGRVVTNPPLTLAGSTSYVAGCQEPIAIQADINQEMLSGNLTVGTQSIAITAKREAPIAKNTTH
jgi:hypothetical protein